MVGDACLRRSSAIASMLLRLRSRTGFVNTLMCESLVKLFARCRLLQHVLISTSLKILFLVSEKRVPCTYDQIRRLANYNTRKFLSPVTPTTKSRRPISRSLATAFRPDSTGIWLSRNTTAYLLWWLNGEICCSKIGPL